MRLFTAIPFPNEIKEAVGEITRGRLPMPINVTDLHLTLNFFADISDQEAAMAKQIFRKNASGLEKFQIEFDKITKFDDQIHLTILPNEKLMTIHSLLQKAFEAFKFSFEDQIFYPHVKLANIKDAEVENISDIFSPNELKLLNFSADRIVLYESQLYQQHVRHIPLIELNLI